MAIYTFSIIQQNVIVSDTTPVAIQESTDNGMALLLNSVSQKTYTIQGMRIWSDNTDQLSQPVTLIKKDPNGNLLQITHTPSLDSYSVQSKLNLKTGNYKLDSNSEMQYTVLPNTQVSITMSLDVKDVKADTGNIKILEKAAGKGHLWDTIDESGMQYKEEKSDFAVETKEEKYNQLLNEPEEQVVKNPESVNMNNFLNFTEKLSQNKEPTIENKPKVVQQSNTDIILFLAAISLVLCFVIPINNKILLPFNK